MTTFTAVSLNDGKTTPVAHVFNPIEKRTDGTNIWENRPTGSVLDAERLQLRIWEDGNMSSKVDLRIAIKELNATTGEQVGTADVQMVIRVTKGCTLPTRKDILALARNALAQTMITNAVHNGERVAS